MASIMSRDHHKWRDLLVSKQFDIMKQELPVVLGWLRYILEKTISMLPNLFPKSGPVPGETIGDISGSDDKGDTLMGIPLPGENTMKNEQSETHAKCAL